MKEKRNIDQPFKVQMSDFKATPSPEVWARIEAQLKKKKDRKVIPLWWKVGGVAALIALLLTIGNGLFTTDNNTPIVTEDPSLVDPGENSVETNGLVENNKEGIVQQETQSLEVEGDLDTSELEGSPLLKTGVTSTQVTQTQEIKDSQIEPLKKVVSNTENRDYGVAKTDSQNPLQQTENQQPKKKRPSENLDFQETEIAKTGVPKEEKISPLKAEEPVLPSEKLEEVGIAKEDSEILKEKAEEPTIEKKSIFDAIEESKQEAITLTEKKNAGDWEVTPNVGPVYYNSLNGGSSIDPMFSDNSQNGEVNFSYGVQVAYVINDRFSVRSGVNNVNVGYSTGGIEVASGPIAFGLKSVTYDNPNRDVLTVFDKGTVPAMTDPNDPYSQLNLKSTSGNAEIRQSITYYEVPLEAKYALLNNRFGINMIGGFSTLLLGDSEVSVNDNGFRSVLGEANNLNSVSFSTNIGLGFDYKISKRFKLNVEPIFKYQLNPYSDSSVDFNPYYFGIYSGLSFKF